MRHNLRYCLLSCFHSTYMHPPTLVVGVVGPTWLPAADLLFPWTRFCIERPKFLVTRGCRGSLPWTPANFECKLHQKYWWMGPLVSHQLHSCCSELFGLRCINIYLVDELCSAALTSTLVRSIGIPASGGAILESTAGSMNTAHRLSTLMSSVWVVCMCLTPKGQGGRFCMGSHRCLATLAYTFTL